MLRNRITGKLRYDIVFFCIVMFENGQCKTLSLIVLSFSVIVPCLFCISLFLHKIFISAIRDLKVEMWNEPELKV